ncbi:fungal-specific transcription factor domain-containing protein [Hypomontagnella submonticulosa]|nr:fungal-specific transcription factor domain-containing protein [Hypomontagnella submonticulosa]
MPRPKRPGAPEPKRRSRNGCWPCKNRKIKCGEERPNCLNCQRTGETCDYSIRLNWEGRRGKRPEPGVLDFGQEVLSPPLPARGFKLVHQYPSSDAPGTRRLEPLTGPASRPKVERSRVPSQPVVPFDNPSSTTVDDTDLSLPNSKRAKLTSDIQSPDLQPAPLIDRRHNSAASSTLDGSVASFRFTVGSGLSAGSPLTPTTSSTYSDDDQRHTSRRLSVNSLLSAPPGPQALQDENTSRARSGLPPIDTRSRSSTDATYYGTDRGFPDRDLGKNDDITAISGASPLLQREFPDTPFGESGDDQFWTEFGFGVETNEFIEEDGYYANAVSIYIPRNLEPLPPKHHFLNHTARVLVPYDDPHANPFRTILPQMAVKDDNLLALLLAYSASHRARVLGHPEPTFRIAYWVNDVFPALREALNDPDKSFSNANLATAIMLASLEIISPKVFGSDIPWQRHLGLARELITARPGGLRGLQTNFRHDPVCSFLWSWAAYLDVIGSLSGGLKGTSSVWIFAYEMDDIDDGYDEIDCIMGFTTRCIYLLAKIADLARKCDIERIGDDLHVRHDWEPSEEVFEEAARIEAAVTESMVLSPVPCKHIHKKGDVEKWDRREMEATNEAFHWAGLVHLYRRIMGRPSEDSMVQMAVQKMIDCFGRIKPGGTAESCLLFPMFTAGCDARDEGHRDLILNRFMTAEKHGMTQIHNARRLMQRVWETEKPWETLVSTEFIG